MKRRKSKRWTAVSRCCRCVPGKWSGGPTTMCATVRPRSSRHSTPRAVIGQRDRRHRTIEFRKFLDTIDAAVPEDLDVHLIVDNYATHKTALIQRWLAKRPRYHLHFTAKGASWINLV